MTPDPMWRELRRLRLLLGVSQESMSKTMGIRRATISDWEAGRFNASTEHVDEYAGILGVTIAWE